MLGVTAASTAFLAQRDVQSFCDAAALAAADSVDERAALRRLASERLPLWRRGARGGRPFVAENPGAASDLTATTAPTGSGSR